MNKKGMTIIELIVSFSLTAVIALFLTEIVLFLRETYVKNGIKTEIVSKQSLISDRIYKLLDSNRIKEATSCGNNCIMLVFEDGVNSQIFFDKNSKKITIGDYVTSLPSSAIIGDMDIETKSFNNNDNYNSIFQIHIPLSSNLLKDKSFDVNVIYQYNDQIDNWNYMWINIDGKTVPTKKQFGATWARIFYHNNKNGTILFNDNDEALNTYTDDKQSLLYALDRFIGNDDKYEFLLQYPELGNEYNRWKQTKKPQDDIIADGTGSSATGYEEIDISWTGFYWGGLVQSSAAAFLSGSVGHTGAWFYAIGCRAVWLGGIPGPKSNTQGITGEVELWVRIDDYLNK